MADDDLTAELDRIAERYKAAEELNVDLLAQFISPDTRSIGGWIAASAMDVPRLLAALRAALELAGEWDADGNEFSWAAAALREAITREITGKGADHA